MSFSPGEERGKKYPIGKSFSLLGECGLGISFKTTLFCWHDLCFLNEWLEVGGFKE
jgi:hypothetical protein